MNRDEWNDFKEQWSLPDYPPPTEKMQAWLLTLLEKELAPDEEGGGIPAYGCRKRGLSEWLWEVSSGARLPNSALFERGGLSDPGTKCLGEQLTPAGRALAERLRETGS